MRLIDWDAPTFLIGKSRATGKVTWSSAKTGPAQASSLVEHTTCYLIIVALPLGRKADQIRCAHTPHPGPAHRNPHHQPPTLPRRHRRRAGQLPQSHPRLPDPHPNIQQTHCHHPL